jgi:hypothetical protein
MTETLYTSQDLFYSIDYSDPSEDLDCPPPAEEFSARFEGSTIGGFGLLNCHLVFLGNRRLQINGTLD